MTAGELQRPPVVTVNRAGLHFRPGDSMMLKVLAFLVLLIRESAFYLLFVTRQLVDRVLNLLLEQLYGPAPPGLPPPRSVLSLSAARLAHRIRTRQLTSQIAVASCIARIRQLEPQLGCLAEERFAEALAEARAADAEIIRLRAELPAQTEDGREMEWALRQADRPLLGVPFTVQETVPARGMQLARGGVAEKDAEAVAALREAGGILLATTRAAPPQGWWEAAGDARLPHDTRRVVGDGGAALVAAAGTPLALSLGGTLLGPAAYCGVFSHAASPRIGTANPALHSPMTMTYTASTTAAPTMKETKIIDNFWRLGEDRRTNDTRGPEVLKKTQYPADQADQDVYRPQVGIVTRHAEDLRATLRLLSRGPVQLGRLRELVPVSKLRIFTAQLPALLATSVACPEVRQALQRAVETLRDRGASVQRAELPEAEHMLEIVRTGLSEGSSAAMPPHARLLALLSGSGGAGGNGRNKERGLQHCRQLRRRLTELLGPDGVLLYPVHPAPAPLRLQRHLRPLDGAAALLAAALQLPGCVVPCGQTATGLPLAVQVLAAPGADHLCLTAAEGMRLSHVAPRWGEGQAKGGKEAAEGVLETDL